MALCPAVRQGNQALFLQRTRQGHRDHDRCGQKEGARDCGDRLNSTDEAVRLTKHAYQAGADGALMVCPYYNRPSQEGLYLHFKKVAEAVPIPIIPYNIASRTGVNMTPETLARLAKISNIVGVKEASGSIKQMSDVIGLCGPDFDVLSGDDIFTLPLMAMGGRVSFPSFPMWPPQTCRPWSMP